MAVKSRPRTLDASTIADVATLLRENKPVRMRLPYGGTLHIDRQLPFLCLYRDPVGDPDVATEKLVMGEASYLTCSARRGQRLGITALVETIVETLAPEFGGFLILELWAGKEVQEDENVDPEAVRPQFRIHANSDAGNGIESVCDALESELRKIRIMKKRAEARSIYRKKTAPPGLSPVFPASRMQELGCQSIGLEVEPIYRNPERADLFPLVLRKLHHGVSRALKRAFFEFARTQTTHRPRHYHVLGPRALTRSVWEVDRKLAEISDAFDFLLLATPINGGEAWRSFKRNGFKKAPVLHYRPLPIDPPEFKRRLYSINLDRIEDPTLGALFREKRSELDRQLTMLSERGTRNFLLSSQQLYDPVDSQLIDVAAGILKQLPGRARDEVSSGSVSPEQFAKRAQREIAKFRKAMPGLESTVRITDEVIGLITVRGNLLVSDATRVAANRVEALVQHEVGTHVLTYWNARAQPFRLLSAGLPGYDELQEGLAVLSEYLVGGLSRARLRLLAGRVMAANYLEEGATFVETFDQLKRTHDFVQRTAFGITLRVYRAGGLTKDAIYLRGLIELLEYLKDGGELEPLFVGKIATKHIPTLHELQLRGVLEPMPIRPSYLRNRESQKRLRALSNVTHLAELVNL